MNMAFRALTAFALFASNSNSKPLGQASQDEIAPKRQQLASDYPIGAGVVKKVKVRSGPYTIPSMMVPSFPTGVHGMIWNKPDLRIEKPCTGYCTILTQQAGLEFPNGTEANIDNGLWLHHMVHFTAGPTRWDPVCWGKLSLPHTAVRQVPSTAERFFSSGNERSIFNYNPNAKDLTSGTGYYLTPQDKFLFLIDLMNMNMESRTVYMTMTYDYLEGELPPNWNQTKTVRFSFPY
jgi:hypothetical protein